MAFKSRHAARTQEWPALPAGRAPLPLGMAPAAERRSVRRLGPKTSSIIFGLVVVGLTSLLSESPAAARKMRSPKLEELRGVWVGGSVDAEREILRLELDDNGKGVVSFSAHPDDPPSAYWVHATKLREFDVAFDLQPTDDDTEPIYLRGHFYFAHFSLKVGGAKPKWERTLFLRSQDVFMKRVLQLEEKARSVSPAKTGA